MFLYANFSLGFFQRAEDVWGFRRCNFNPKNEEMKQSFQWSRSSQITFSWSRKNNWRKISLCHSVMDLICGHNGCRHAKECLFFKGGAFKMWGNFFWICELRGDSSEMEWKLWVKCANKNWIEKSWTQICFNWTKVFFTKGKKLT